jgi:ParB family chromosome partitioning protein
MMKISEIVVNERFRKIDINKVKELSESINEVGLLCPVLVSKRNVLIAGNHRIEACKLLGMTEIETKTIDATDLIIELAEIDENLIRNELHYIDRGNHLTRRKEIYEVLHPETIARNKEGHVNNYKSSNEINSFEVYPLTGEVHKVNPLEIKAVIGTSSFVKNTSEKMQVSERKIEQELQISKNITPEVKEILKENDITKTDAIKISRMPQEQQKKAVESIVNKIDDEINTESKPHVSNNSGENEWYTPIEYIESARKVMGSIDLDPASCEFANKSILAKKIYTIQDSGLTQKWDGNVWLNPPYSSDLMTKFIQKVSKSYNDGDIQQAIVLTNNATETNWFNSLVEHASAIVFIKGRIKFISTSGKNNTPLQGQSIVYFGRRNSEFLNEFERFGWGAKL